jgi:hypothetical protein
VIDELMAPSSSPGHRWSCLSHSKQARRSKIGRGERNCELHGRGLACLRRARGTTPSRLRVLVPESPIMPATLCTRAGKRLVTEARRHGGTSASPSAKRRVMSASAAVGVFLSSEPACCGTGISGVQSMKTHPIARHVSKVDCGSCC